MLLLSGRERASRVFKGGRLTMADKQESRRTCSNDRGTQVQVTVLTHTRWGTLRTSRVGPWQIGHFCSVDNRLSALVWGHPGTPPTVRISIRLIFLKQTCLYLLYSLKFHRESPRSAITEVYMYFYACVEHLIFLFLNPVFKKFMYKPIHISSPSLLEIRDTYLQRNALKNKIKNDSIPGFLSLSTSGLENSWWRGAGLCMAGAQQCPWSLLPRSQEHVPSGTKRVSRHCQTFSKGQMRPQLRNTVLA